MLVALSPAFSWPRRKKGTQAPWSRPVAAISSSSGAQQHVGEAVTAGQGGVQRPGLEGLSAQGADILARDALGTGRGRVRRARRFMGGFS